MGFYYSQDGRWMTQTLGFPYTCLTEKGKIDTAAAIKIQRWWRNFTLLSLHAQLDEEEYEELNDNNNINENYSESDEYLLNKYVDNFFSKFFYTLNPVNIIKFVLGY